MGWERVGPTMGAYGEFLELTIGPGGAGRGLVEQAIIPRLV